MCHNEKKHTCPCLTVCPVGAISVDKKTNLIKIDEEKCIGCGSCVAVCENEAISINPNTGKAQVDYKKCHREQKDCNCDKDCDCGCQDGKKCTCKKSK